MAQIFIVLTNTGTILSKLIRWTTRAPYQHVSISLDKELHKMYSFGRKNPRNPFHGGFVHEGIDCGTFKRFKNTKAKIIQTEISDETYNQIENRIQYMNEHVDDFGFNIAGMIVCSLGLRLNRKNKFYCSEFVRSLFQNEHDLPIKKAMKPIHFNKFPGPIIYQGLLRQYQA